MLKQFSNVFLLLVVVSSASAATIHADSYVVSVQTADNKTICGGALIGKNTVVTSATCLAFYDADQLAVGINNGSQIIKTKAHSFKVDFDFVTMENDVAILKLAESVDTSFIKLASKKRKTGCTAVVISPNLNKVPVTIINYKECVSGDYGWSEDDVFSTMVCGLVKENNVCVGQAGSPLVHKNKLIGLVSWGGCGNNGHPAVFTDITAFQSWIKQTTKQL
ncbi:PREDICTED: trypsin-like [Bactrocera latifrons]|uniref:Trypsin n=1 Tax=Bactrocera latifrons TaxID=174628 RepID=A0A0K8TZX9_BACLA|nr:PREDICTED: trypsin-like [Bactrocera latifrons]